jgi:hypothetical protein
MIRRASRTVRGITLVELLVASVMAGILSLAVVRAFVTGIAYEPRMQTSRDAFDRIARFESGLSKLLREAVLTEDEEDDASFFIAGLEFGSTASGIVDDRLTFTAGGTTVALAALDADEDFQTLNERFGPQGGLAEVSIGLTPVGNPTVTDGLFLRRQRPADGDPSQGGDEILFESDVREISFEFFDGQVWQTTWDTRTGERRIPAAVRVTYRLENEDDLRTFVVRLPLSDVTPENPVGLGQPGLPGGGF